MPLVIVRSQRDLDEQVRKIESFLSDGRTDEDAAATASRGWRFVTWDPEATECTRADCPVDHTPHPREVPRWQAEIDRAIDRWPRHVVLGVPRAINGMTIKVRRIVRGHATMGQSFRELGRQEGLDHKTVRVWYDAALESVARAVWDDEGQPRW